MLFVFSALSLGMIYISQAHLSLSGLKRNSQLLDLACENGIKIGYGQLTKLFSRASSPIVITSDEWEKIKEDSLTAGTGIIETILQEDIPLSQNKTWEDQTWDLLTSFKQINIQQNQTYLSAVFSASIRCAGQIKNFKPQRISSLLVSVDIYAGYLPLAMFPFLVSQKIPEQKKSSFLEDNQIELAPGNILPQPPQLIFDEQELLKGFQKDLIEKTFRIKIFKPQDLSASKLRTILDLEPSENPIPDGVYLIKDDLGLGGLFIQGDVLEMGLAVYEDYQVVSFIMEAGCWMLMFSPKKSLTFFLSPEGEEIYDLLPLEIIIINGNVFSLGGGIFKPPDTIELIKGQKIPAILRGVNLTIVASEKITISNHLLYQGLKWEQGMPYVKESDTKLHLFSSGQDVFGSETENSGIRISEDSPEDLKIQASVSAAGEGLSIEGTRKNISLFGSLQFNNIDSALNKLNIMFDDRFLQNNGLVKNSPVTTKPALHLQFYQPEEWVTNSGLQED